MSVVRREHNGNFTIVPNAIFVDKRLSIEAKGVLGYLLSRPPNWEVRHGQLMAELGIGRRWLERILKEIIAAGYMERDEAQGRDECNRFTAYDYVVRDVPSAAGGEVPVVHTAHRRKPLRDMYTGSNKTERNKTENIKTEVSPPLSPPDASERKGDSLQVEIQADAEAGADRRSSAQVEQLKDASGGEVIPPGEPTFDEVWNACGSDQGLPGPALAAWRRLSSVDRQKVGNLIGPHGLDLSGMWLCSWLQARRWEAPQLARRAGGIVAAADRLINHIDGTDDLPHVTLEPHSEAWYAERDRMVAAGEPVGFMEARAAGGKGWVKYLTPPSGAGSRDGNAYGRIAAEIGCRRSQPGSLVAAIDRQLSAIYTEGEVTGPSGEQSTASNSNRDVSPA